MLENHNSDEKLSLEIFTSEEYYRQYMQEVMGVITRYRKELRLLFLDTRDTRFEDYWEPVSYTHLDVYKRQPSI